MTYHRWWRNYVRNSNRRHILKTRAKAIISDLEKWDVPASVRIRTGSVEGKRRQSTFWRVSVKLISKTRPLLWLKRDAHSWCASPIMKSKETRVARGMSPFIMKVDACPIPSPITKERTSPFITNVGASPISNIQKRVLQRNVTVSYAPYKAHSQLGQNSGGARSALFLPYSYCFFPFLEVPSKNLAVMN
jgi:hypothetical protein